MALAVFVLLLLTNGGYGYHRDELYFIQAGRHPAFGYDDQPPLTPLIGRASSALFGQTPTGLRMASALALIACIVLAALTSRELGGGRAAQALASASLAASGALFIGHLLSTTTFDFLAWTLLLYLVTRLLRGDDPRLWLAVGLVSGFALQNKWLVLLLLVSLAAGLAAARRRDVLAGPWPWVAALLALAIWLPNLIWQAHHGWPQRELSGQIAAEDPLGNRVSFLPFQLVIVSPFLAFVWIAGVRWLLRDARARPFRALGYGWIALVGICLASAAKQYYALGWYPALLGAGGVALEGWLERRRARILVSVALALSLPVAALISLPLVPQRSLAHTPLGDINPDAVETVGWPRFTDAVARVWRGLPARQRAGAVILTANYGEAGALRRFGPARGLPEAYSGHNSFESFGRPPGRAGPVILVGFDPGFLPRGDFTHCRLVARFDNRLGIDNEEQGAPFDVCDGPARPWALLWHRLHHLDA